MPQRRTSPTVDVDGRQTSWVYAVTGGGLNVQVVTGFNAVWDLAYERDTRQVLVDVPVRLPESDRHTCDRATRERLDSRAAIVFFAPVRSALGVNSHEATSAANCEQTGADFSIQTWYLILKIRKVDAVLHEVLRARSRAFESHPGFALAVSAGDPFPEPKSTPEGRARRLSILRTVFGGCDGRNSDGNDDSDDGSEVDATDDRGFDTGRIYCETLDRTLHRDMARDDVLDAPVLTVATRHPLVTPPGDPPTGAVGLEMAIRVPMDGPPL